MILARVPAIQRANGDGCLLPLTVNMRGRDPVHWKESRRHPLILASDALEIRYGKMADFIHSDTEDKLRVLAPLGLHLIEDGLRSTLSSMLIDKSAEVGRKERQKVAPNGWKGIIADQGHRFATIKSYLSDTLIAVDPGEFRDLKWVNFENHMPSIFPDSSALASPDADRTFGLWLHSFIRAPYDATCEYLGRGNRLLLPNNIDDNINDIRVVRARFSNGLNADFIRTTGKLYFMYEKPDLVAPERGLSPDAPRFFVSGRVVVLDAWHADVKPRLVPVHELTDALYAALHVDVRLPSPDIPANVNPLLEAGRLEHFSIRWAHL